MDVEQTKQGAVVDVTEEAQRLIEVLADAFADNEKYIADLLVSLAEARQLLRTLKAQAATGRDVPDSKVEAAAAAVDGIRDAVVEMLDPRERVTTLLTAPGCQQIGAELLAAGEAAELRWRNPLHFPHQREGKAA